MIRLTVLCLVVVLMAPASGLANDGAAGLEGGNLRFKNLKGVRMAEEDLFISPSLVRVKYRFENTTARSIRTLVSFPIHAWLNSGIAWDTEAPNPSRLTVTVNGVARPFKTKRTTDAHESELTVQHYWEQEFPAGKSVVIEHTYVPVLETGILYSTDSHDYFPTQLEKAYCATPEQANRTRQQGLKFKPLRYILRTARTWDGPIGHFKLRLEAGDSSALFLCSDLTLVPSADGKAVEADAHGYVPQHDLNIAVVGAFTH